jgi:hypothetical protein
MYLYLSASPTLKRNDYARRNCLRFKRADILECLTNQTGAYEKDEKTEGAGGKESEPRNDQTSVVVFSFLKKKRSMIKRRDEWINIEYLTGCVGLPDHVMFCERASGVEVSVDGGNTNREATD